MGDLAADTFRRMWMTAIPFSEPVQAQPSCHMLWHSRHACLARVDDILCKGCDMKLQSHVISLFPLLGQCP